MSMTAEVIQLEGARRARAQRFTVDFSTLVTHGDDAKGLVTLANDPKSIEYIKSLLANPDFAVRGRRREEVAIFGRENSFSIDVGPFLANYSISHDEGRLLIESVFFRRQAAPDPSPSKLSGSSVSRSASKLFRRASRGRGILFCVAAALIFALVVPCLYLSIHRVLWHDRGSIATLRHPTENSPVRLSSAELRRMKVQLPEWKGTAVSAEPRSEFGIVSSDTRAGSNNFDASLDPISKSFSADTSAAVEHSGWDMFDKRLIASVPFGSSYVEAPTDQASHSNDQASHSNDFLAPLVAENETQALTEKAGPPQKDRLYLPREGKWSCEIVKNKSGYFCSVIVGHLSSKNPQKRLVGRFYLSGREGDGSDLAVDRASFALETDRSAIRNVRRIVGELNMH